MKRAILERGIRYTVFVRDCQDAERIALLQGATVVSVDNIKREHLLPLESKD